jgi:hypothetical protein
MSMNLGERMRASAVERQEKAAREEARKLQEARDAEERLVTNFCRFFDDAISGFEKDILAGREVKAAKLKYSNQSYEAVSSVLPIRDWPGRTKITEFVPRPKYRDAWAKYAEWASGNSLQFVGWLSDDGIGYESWYEISVEPVPA